MITNYKNSLLMSTKVKNNENRMKLDKKSDDNYSPELETSIWYN